MGVRLPVGSEKVFIGLELIKANKLNREKEESDKNDSMDIENEFDCGELCQFENCRTGYK